MSCALGNDPRGCGCNCNECFAYLEQGMKVNRFLVNGCNQDSAKLMASILSIQEQMKGVMREMALFESRDKKISDLVNSVDTLVKNLAQPEFVEIEINDQYVIPGLMYGSNEKPIQLTAQVSDLYGDGSAITSIKIVGKETFAGAVESWSLYVPDADGKQQKYSGSTATFAEGTLTLESVTATEVSNACPAISGLYLNMLFDTSGWFVLE